MACIKTMLLAFVALSLLTVAQAAQYTISHNAAVRRHAAMVHHRPARRSVAIGDGKMMQKRQTAQQLADAAAQKHWNDVFQLKNSIWQQAAIAALSSGQTPPTFDQYWDGKPDPSLPGDSGSGSAEPSPAPQQQDAPSGSDSNSDSSSSSNSASSTNTDSSAEASPAPQPQTQQQTTQSSSSSSEDDCEQQTAQASSDPSGDDCDEQSSDSSSSSSSAADSNDDSASTSNVADTKNQATQQSNNNNDSNSDSGSSAPSTSGSFQGQATYYAPGLGACGWTNGPSDYIVAISHSLFDSFGTGNPNNNPVCGHKIAATYQGKTITVSVADRCEGCAWGDLDFTPTGFQQLASMDKGRLDGLTWSWIGAAP